MSRAEWIEHRRGDGALVGWLVPDGEAFHVVDLLGRTRTDAPIDWVAAEEALDTLGIGYLADRYTLRMPDGAERRVRIGDVSTSGIIAVADDFGIASAIGAKPELFSLPFPAPAELTWIG
jgi:selenophosphate synthetase-related protein